MITIMNLRSDRPVEAYDVRVDRTSVLGNPFHMRTEIDRNLVCDKYKEWFEMEYADSMSSVRSEMRKLYNLYTYHGKLRLFCWCKPKRCHAETIMLKLLDMKTDEMKLSRHNKRD
jgi:hypothetical protein